MTELVTLLLDIVSLHNGVVSWEELIAGVPHEQRHNVPKALQIAKQEGKLKRSLRYENGVRFHEIVAL